MWGFLSSTATTSARAELRRARHMLRSIEIEERRFREESDDRLKEEMASLRYRAKCGQSAETLMPKTFAIVRETAARRLNMRPFDVQVLAAVLLARGCFTEMATGEGKTLAAVLPLCLQALFGQGAHLLTANDFLAQRDAEWMRPVYEMLGFSVGVINGNSRPDERRAAYRCDITYGTAKEFGFDFLRDRLQGEKHDFPHTLTFSASTTKSQAVHRNFYYALVDEADSILIDEARIPLIISERDGESSEVVAAASRWAADVIENLRENEHYSPERNSKSFQLTSAGRAAILSCHKPQAISSMQMKEIFHCVQQALFVQERFRSDQQYVVVDGKAIIVDEFNGRLAQGRRWQQGLHQAIEAGDGLEISPVTQTAAQITMQAFFNRYENLAGMSGTIMPSAKEFRKVYRSPAVAVPRNRPCHLVRWPEQVLKTENLKWQAVVEETFTVSKTGRPVLIGTRSIAKSQRLSELLDQARISHQVLNARHTESEAKLIAGAGQPGRVTVATNMAGRGTDIRLAPGVFELGGLHVICTELHEAARIDRQLIGRAARQGDPGSFRIFSSWQDEILSTAFGDTGAAQLRDSADRCKSTTESVKIFRHAQNLVERRHARQRRQLLKQTRRRHSQMEQLGLDPFIDIGEESVLNSH